MLAPVLSSWKKDRLFFAISSTICVISGRSRLALESGLGVGVLDMRSDENVKPLLSEGKGKGRALFLSLHPSLARHVLHHHGTYYQ